MVPPVQSLDPLTYTNVMDVAFIETQLFGLSGSDFGIDNWPAVQSKYPRFEWLISRKSERGGGGGCHKIQREKKVKRERKMVEQEETVTDTEFTREKDNETYKEESEKNHCEREWGRNRHGRGK